MPSLPTQLGRALRSMHGQQQERDRNRNRTERERESQQGREVKLDDGCNLRNWVFLFILPVGGGRVGVRIAQAKAQTKQGISTTYIYLGYYLFIFEVADASSARREKQKRESDTHTTDTYIYNTDN